MKQQKKTTGIRHLTVDVTVIVDRNATTANVAFYGPVFVDATGSTKREQGDLHDETTGIELAVGRALENLSKKLQHLGRAQVNTAVQRRRKDQVRAARRRRNLRITLESPPRSLMPLSDIQERHGLDAAVRAAKQRGEEWPPRNTKDTR